MREVTNLHSEPDYPYHTTLRVSFSDPELCCHEPNKFCDIQEPHNVSDCNWWEALTNPVTNDTYREEAEREQALTELVRIGEKHGLYEDEKRALVNNPSKE